MKQIIAIALLLMCSSFGYAQRNNNNHIQQTTVSKPKLNNSSNEAKQRRLEEQRRREAAEREEQQRLEQEKLNALRWDDTQKTLCYNGQTYPMVFVSGGSFTMGEKYVHTDGKQGDKCDQPDARLVSVTLSNYYIGKYEITQDLWAIVMGSNPSSIKGNRMPVTNVSRGECLAFISRLNSLTGQLFRLPTEEQWEFAARGGVNSQGYIYSGSNNLNSVGWYSENSGNVIHEVGQKKPNELGLYDMSGNICEWCLGIYGFHRYGPQSWACSYSQDLVTRGGNYNFSYDRCTSTIREIQEQYAQNGSIGFRIILIEE